MSAVPAAEKSASPADFFRWHSPPASLRYAAAVLCAAAALSAARWLEIHFETAPVSLFLCAVMLSAWFGGAGPGTLAALLCILAFTYYFVAPTHTFAVQMKEIPRLAIFILSTFFVGALSAAQRRATQLLRKSEAQWRTVFEHNPTMYFMLDEQANVVSVNPFGAEQLGYLVDELIGRSALDLVYEAHRDRVKRNVALCFEQPGQTRTWEISKRRKDGTTLWVCETAKAMPTVDDRAIVLVVCEDITERRQGEAERAARRAAEMANQAKSEFLARMSHELRTPLTGILGYADILRGDRTLTERQLHGVGVIRQSGEHLLMLINDILDFARIEAGKLELSVAEISMARFVPAIADIIRVRAEEKQLAFRCELAPDLPASVVADGRRLRQVLLNLLANAVKFTDRGEVSLGVSFSPAGRLRFEVRDTGIGIDADRRESIFHPFEQAGDLQHRLGGTGLGLAISRQLVRLMGGDIEVESRVGEGSTFRFELDVPVVQPVPATPGADDVITGYLGPRRKILVVDDVAANRLVLRDMLGPLGFEIAEAADGRQGLEKARAVSPDLIVMDSVMPDMDGLEATRLLRELPGVGEVAVIAISANASGTNEAMALAAGADAFLSKPIDLSALLAQIGELLQLQWTSEPRGSVLAPRDEAPVRLIVPPPGELAALHDLALRGNMHDIAQEAARLSRLDVRYGAFADELRQLAKSYQSKAILRLVERHLNGGTSP